MCQLCTLTSIAESHRWPQPLEPLIADLENPVNTTHVEAVALRVSSLSSDSASNQKETTDASHDTANADRTAHIATIRTLQTLLDVLELARKDWWNDPIKKLQRHKWEEAREEAKLRAVQKINNATADMIESMRARTGVYVRWNLGIEDGDI